MNMFDPLRIFDQVQHAFDDDFGFDSPIFKFPPIPTIDSMPSFDPLWPFHLPHRKIHRPTGHGTIGDIGFGNNWPWRVTPDNSPTPDNNPTPDSDKHNPPTKVKGKLYLKNYQDVKFVLKFLHVFVECVKQFIFLKNQITIL